MSGTTRYAKKLEWSTYVGDDATAGDLSATITGTPTCLDPFRVVSYQFTWAATGSPTATISFQGSNNYDPDTGTGTWVAFDSALVYGLSSCHPAGSAGDHLIALDTVTFRAKWIRPKFTASSGTGTLRGWVSGAEV